MGNMSMESTGRVFSGGIWEERYGYSRAVVVGDRVIVSGCTATVDGEVRHHGDAYLQSRTAMDIALEAVAMGGLSREDVVMVRYYVVEHGHFDQVGRAIGEVFGTFIIPNMFARAARGQVSAKEAVADAEAQIKPIFEKWRARGLVGG